MLLVGRLEGCNYESDDKHPFTAALAPPWHPGKSCQGWQGRSSSLLTAHLRPPMKGPLFPFFALRYCIQLAAQAEFAYAAVQYGRECYGGDSLAEYVTPSDYCDTPCTGDSQETCGGVRAENSLQLGVLNNNDLFFVACEFRIG